MAGGTVTITGGNVIHTFNSSGYLTPLTLVGNSLRFRRSATAFLSRTFASNPTTRTKCHWHWNVKRGSLGSDQRMFSGYSGTSGDSTWLIFNSTDQFYFSVGGNNGQLATNAVFRDPAAWYTFDLAFDSTQAIASERAKLWVNGVLQTWASGTVTQNSNMEFALANANNRIGANWDSTLTLDGYMTEVQFIDGQALTPNSFGSYNSFGVWQPIVYGGSYGTNGFYLPFTNSGTLSANYLVVAGGGGGGTTGGGGAGGFITGSLTINAGASYAITVGAGGAGSPGGTTQGSNGTNSVFSSITSTGGGGGGSNDGAGAGIDGSSGGSGGGGSLTAGIRQGIGGAGTGGQGSNGGNGNALGLNYAGGGGGGAGATGANAGDGIGGNGGAGTASSISGSSVTYAGGGGGYGLSTNGSGGSGGGGGATVAGTANTGGGGGGSGTAAGGSGVVIISYAGTPKFTGGTITQSGGNTIHTFTSSGTLGLGIAADYSPQGNNWTTNNISLTAGVTYDSMTDVPTLTSTTAANYAVLNPLDKYSTVVLSNGNLNCSEASASWLTMRSTIAFPTTGKWYVEGLL
jgi:hypothetical protein